MKKYFVMALMAIVPFAFTSCGDDETEDINGIENNQNGSNHNGGQTTSSLAGTWEMQSEDEMYELTLTDKNFTFIVNVEKVEGTYTVKDGKITLTPTKFYEKSPNTGGWMETKPEDTMPETGNLLLMKNNSVMILEFQDEEAEDMYGIHDDFIMLYKKGATINASNDEVQGKWYWYLRGDKNIIRTYLELNGNKFDLIIPIWRERYQGTYTYNNGIITYNVTKFTTRDDQDESLDNLYTGWRDLDEEEKQWKEPSFGLQFSRAFIANGNCAYSFLANLPAYFEKR